MTVSREDGAVGGSGVVVNNRVVVAVLPTARADAKAMRWERAVQYLPSIDTPAIGAWLADHPPGPRAAIVAPGADCPGPAFTTPHLEISVPPHEYANFTSAIATGSAPFRWEHTERHRCTIVRPQGILDARSYRLFADELAKFAADEPRALLVVVDHLQIRSQPVLTVFTTLADRLADWPGIPLILVAEKTATFFDLTRSALINFVHICPSIPAGLHAVDTAPPRRCARLDLPPDLDSHRRARRFLA